MKKTIITIVSFISIIILSSCGNSAKEQRLIQMRDSIQEDINWHQETIEKQFAELDSLYNCDRDKYGYLHDFYMTEIDILTEALEKDQNKLFQIELQLTK